MTMTDEERAKQNATADHDLLIRLDTKFDILSGKFDELSKNLVGRVDGLEKEAATAKQIAIETSRDTEDLKADVRFLNRYVWMALGAVALAQIYFLYRQIHQR